MDKIEPKDKYRENYHIWLQGFWDGQAKNLAQVENMEKQTWEIARQAISIGITLEFISRETRYKQLPTDLNISELNKLDYFGRTLRDKGELLSTQVSTLIELVKGKTK